MNKKGFTLIELLVVIAIIGLLSTISVVALNTARARSRDAKRVSDIKQIQTALELYFNEENEYPSAVTAGGTIISSTSTVYMAAVPTGPSPADGTCASTAYTYAQTLTGASYTLAYCLGAATGDIAAGVHTATPAGIK
jgi:prepilin-type N-terminal cleavage/methylation domain-containing protein